jgi:hypothetical protein
MKRYSRRSKGVKRRRLLKEAVVDVRERNRPRCRSKGKSYAKKRSRQLIASLSVRNRVFMVLSFDFGI